MDILNKTRELIEKSKIIEDNFVVEDAEHFQYAVVIGNDEDFEKSNSPIYFDLVLSFEDISFYSTVNADITQKSTVINFNTQKCSKMIKDGSLVISYKGTDLFTCKDSEEMNNIWELLKSKEDKLEKEDKVSKMEEFLKL